MGCGYELPNPHAKPWSPSSLDPMHTGEYQICPGYTTQLPEVTETVRARNWKASLPVFCGNHEITEALITNIEILDGSEAAADSWELRNPEKKA